MKKLLLSFFILFCLQLVPVKAQWVAIPDTNFVNWLTTNYPSCMNGNLMDTTCVQIVNEDSIIVSFLNISTINGLEYFDSLKYLKCNNNFLSSLPQLPVSLKYLKCNNNQLTSLPQLPSTLKYIDCYYNLLSSLPSLPNFLIGLYCSNNQLINLPFLPNSITGLSCMDNLLNSLPSLPNSLIGLDCENNQLTSLPILPSNLWNLNCGFNQLTSLPSLPNSLFSLKCYSNQLTYLPILSNSLYQLYCESNQLTSLPQLPSSLQTLQCSLNQLTNLPTLPGNLELLSCSDNQLTNLPVLPNSLLSLWCNVNNLTNIPLLPNLLQTLVCENNLLTSLPALPNTLQWLDCSFNQLSSLPHYPDMMFIFRINNNNISCLFELPVVSNAVDISNNPLTCVPNQTNYSLGLPLCMDNDPVNNPFNCQTFANITGFVYKDTNSNCIFNITDLKSENIPVKLYDSQNNFLAFSSTVNGVFSFTALQPDTFKVKINDSTLLVSMTCGQANNQIVILDSVNQTISNINFPVVCDSAFDINVQSLNTNGFVFPGQTHSMNTSIVNNVIWNNLNCLFPNYSGTVTLEVNGPVSFVSSVSGALNPIVNGNTFTYNISDFNSLTPNSFGLRLLTNTTAQAGDQICVHVEINPTPIDSDTTNNVYDFCYQVVNSYDPNMKEVYPVNVLPGYDDWFTYTIHFQNTGNAPAFNIRLRDTLDANLDINSFEVRGYSHPANISLNGNILTVRFNNIMLPDSTTDYEGSMGYFQYRLKPLPNLPNGTQIENTAYIYFDYNAPIITNTTQNNFVMPVKTINVQPQASHLSLYPNPSNGIFTFNESKNIKTVEVYNMMGELVFSQGNAKIINLQAYPKGVYVARVNGTQVCRLVKE